MLFGYQLTLDVLVMEFFLSAEKCYINEQPRNNKIMVTLSCGVVILKKGPLMKKWMCLDRN